MLGWMKKKMRIDSHKLQALCNVVKKGGDDVIKDFEEKFQEVRVEGKRTKASAVNYTSSSSGSKILDSKNMKEELEALYISEARKRFQRSRSIQRRQSFDRQRSLSQGSCLPPRQSRFDSYKSGEGRQHDR